MLTEHEVQYLQNANVLKLQSAARLAGLAFKNGALDKAGIISRLTAFPSTGRATIAALQRMDTQNSAPAPKPKADFSDWADDTPSVTAPTPPSMPVMPPSVPSIDMSAYALRTDVHAWLNSYAPASTVATLSKALTQLHARTQDRFAEYDASIVALKTRLADLSPIAIHLPGKTEPKIIKGAHKQFPKLLRYLRANGRLILTGEAGTGKSLAAKMAAEAFDLPFYLQTPFSEAYEYLGHRDAQGEYHDTPTFRAFTQGGVLLVDEADACLPDAFLPGNPIFDGNGFANFGDGQLHQQHPNFYVILNMNTDGSGASMKYTGRNRLDGATLARFGVRVHWTVDENIERSMSQGQETWLKAIHAVREFMAKRDIHDTNATPRHLKTGAILLQDPANTREELLADILKSGALAEVWADVLRLPAVQAFLQRN